MKAMILAAGRGERMRPLTDTLPKPLIEVRGKPLVEWHLERIAAAGIRDVVINVSHLAERIMDALGDGRRWGLSIAWSREDPPLETAGGIATARVLLGEDPFVLVNADVHCDHPLAALAGCDLGPLLGRIVLVPNPDFRPQGDFSLNAGRVGNDDAPRYTYSGGAMSAPPNGWSNSTAHSLERKVHERFSGNNWCIRRSPATARPCDARGDCGRPDRLRENPQP